MRVIVLVLSLMALAAQAGHAQALLIILFGDKLSTEKFQMGIQADLVWSGYTGVESYDPRFSWAFGAYGEINLSRHWHLQPELTMKTPVGATKMPVTTPGSPFSAPTGDATLDSIRAVGTVTRSGNVLTLPGAGRSQPQGQFQGLAEHL